MNILAIDFSSKLASAAVFSDGRRVALVTSETLVWNGVEPADSSEKPLKLAGASALLTPLVQATIEQSGLKTSDFQLIALPVGPGQFTGLRVAVVTAKAFAYATGADVLGLNTLEVLAAKAHFANPSHAGPIRVAVNAQRGQLFAGQYRSTGDWQVESIGDNQIVNHQAWVESWDAGDLISGAGLKLIQPELEPSGLSKSSKRGYQIADQADWDCDAASVARLANQYYKNGRRDDLWSMKPLYFRPSAAEENRLARHSLGNK